MPAAAVGIEEQVDEQPLDRSTVVADLVVAVGAARRMLEPVQRALAGQRRAVGRLASSLPAKIAIAGSWRS